MRAGTLLFLLGCIFLTVVEAVNYQTITGTQSHKGPLMVLMLDGFRWDYVQRLHNRMPGFSRFLREGSRAEYVETVFPVVSYPNWQTLSTGLYTEDHDIISNNMVNLTSDPTGNDIFTLSNEESTKKPEWWQHVEPIWITSTKQQKRTFLRRWSRCDVPFHGLSPEECTGYTETPGVQPINKTLSVGLEKLLDGFDLVMLYGEEPDLVGHDFGPDSYEMQQTLMELDSVFAEFLQKLDKYPSLKAKLNIIIVSDHGMMDVRPSRGFTYYRLDDYLDEQDVLRVIDQGSFMNIQPITGRENFVYERLKTIPGVDVYMKEDIPEELHYKNSELVLRILLVARPGTIVIGMQSDKQISRPNPDLGIGTFIKGLHGYTPDVPDMRAIFFARGPAFKRNYVHSPIEMVDIYQLYTYILGITPQPHNGTWTDVAGMLVSDPQHDRDQGLKGAFMYRR